MKDLNIDILGAQNIFSNNYYHILTNNLGVAERRKSAFAKDKMPKDIQVENSTVRGWLMRGAIREDDYPPDEGFIQDILCNNNPQNPQDDPHTVKPTRSLSHFFDPINNEKSIAPPGTINYTAPSWALGLVDPFVVNPGVNGQRHNHFTIIDAYDAMYRALTGHYIDVGLTPVSPDPSGAAQTPAEIRQAYWATTFRALGDVMHLLEDMAQPQHTRLDAHNGQCTLLNGIAGHTSIYEAYMEARAEGKDEFKIIRNGEVVDSEKIITRGFNYSAPAIIPMFNRARDYFSTETGQAGANPVNGRGLADYTNRGFFTVGTNIDSTRILNPNYSLPSIVISDYTNGLNGYGKQLIKDGDKQENYLTATVTDVNDGTAMPSVKISQESIWGDFLDDAVDSGVEYSIPLEVLDERSDLVIPRAMGYSAGLINYFFRGRLEITPPDQYVYAIEDYATNTAGFDNIKLKIRNISADINAQAQDMASGTLVAVAKFLRNTCFQPDFSGDPYWPNYVSNEACRSNDFSNMDMLVSQPIDINIAISQTVAQEFSFDFSTNPIPYDATDLVIQVVYEGTIGSEYGVATTTKDISETNHRIIANNYDHMYVNNVVENYQTDIITNPVSVDAVFTSLRGAENCPVNVDCTTLQYKLDYVNSVFGDPAAFPITLKFGFGTSATVATAPHIVQVNLLPGQYARLMYLDGGAPVNINIEGTQPVININGLCPLNCPIVNTIWNLQVVAIGSQKTIWDAKNLTYLPARGTGTPLTTFRGLYFDVWVSYSGPYCVGNIACVVTASSLRLGLQNVTDPLPVPWVFLF